MDVFSKAKIASWTIIVLVLLNILSLATLWYTGTQRPSPPRFLREMGGPRFEGFFQDELGLDSAQTDKFEGSVHRFIEQSFQINDGISGLSHEMLDELFKSSPNQAVIDSLMGEIGILRTSLDKAALAHFNELKQICGPEQYPALQRMLLDIINIARPMQNPLRPGQRPDWLDRH